MTQISQEVSTESLTLMGGFSHYVVGNVFAWPYFMGYLFLIALIAAGISLPKDTFMRGLLYIGRGMLIILLFLMMFAIIIAVSAILLMGAGVPVVGIWNISFMLAIAVGVVVAVYVIKI